MKNTIPKKIPVFFHNPKKIPAFFIDLDRPKKIPWNYLSLKYVSEAPGLQIIDHLMPTNGNFPRQEQRLQIYMSIISRLAPLALSLKYICEIQFVSVTDTVEYPKSHGFINLAS